MPVAHDARCLPDARRDERNARGQRLEHTLRPSLLTGGDHVRIEGVVRRGQLAATLRHGVPIRDPAPLELAADVATGRPRKKHVQLGDLRRDSFEGSNENVRPLHELRLESFAPADAVLLERADHEGVGRQVERRSRCVAVLRRDERELLDVDSDRDHVDCARLDARLEHDLSHLLVGHLDPREALGRRAESVVCTVELRVAGRPRPSMEIRRGEAMRRLHPAGLQSLEMAGEEDRLLGCEPCPPRSTDVVPETSRGRFEMSRVLVHGPRRSLADGEET